MTLEKKQTIRLTPSACCSALSPECSGKVSGDPEWVGLLASHLSSPFSLSFTYYMT